MRRAPALRALAVLVPVLALAPAVAPAPAAAATEWLCLPGQAPDPCRDALDTTVQEADGSTRVERPALPEAPAVDCFYVYPTASEQPGTNARKEREPSVVAIARYQASRFSQRCRVYAPLYRQLTLLSIATGTPQQRATGFRTAYADVLEAWRTYLATRNAGRPFVLLGHSQGTRMLRKLLREEIDPDPAVRERLVSAILLGGNVLTRRGSTTGGDARQVPLCTAPGQPGCLIAFSAFAEDPPEGARFGRPPATDDTGAGFPAGPDFEVACTNPASLGADERRTLTSLLRSEPFPGVLGAGLVVTFGGPPPSASTPWIRPGERYSGRCERRAGAHVLFVEPVGSARRLNAFPEPGWGLHLTDGNIALGDLVDNLGAQIAAHAAARAPVRPRVGLAVTGLTRRDARGRRCAPGTVRLRATGADARRIRTLEGVLRGRSVGRDVRAPFALVVRRARLRRGALERVRVRVALRDGRRVTLTRAVRACA